MNIGLYCIAGFLTLGALLTVGTIGKPRKPVEPAAAVIIVVIDAVMVACLIAAALRLR